MEAGNSGHAKQVLELKKELKTKDEEIAELKLALARLQSGGALRSANSVNHSSQLHPEPSSSQSKRLSQERGIANHSALSEKDILLEKYKKKLLSYKSKLLLLQAQNNELLAKSGGTSPSLSQANTPDAQLTDVHVMRTKLQAYKLKLKQQNETVKELTAENASLTVQVQSLQDSMISLVKQLEDSQRSESHSLQASNAKRKSQPPTGPEEQIQQMSAQIEKQAKEIEDLVRRNRAGSQFVEEIKANFEDVTNKFETKYLELQRENRALEEACTSLASQLEALSMDAPSSASINAHASKAGGRQAVALPTALDHEIASLQSMFSSVTSQLSQGMTIVSQNVSTTLQQEKEREKELKIKERIALNNKIRSLFHLPDSEEIIEWYAFTGGYLYITTHHVCIDSVLGADHNRKEYLSSITSLNKCYTKIFIPTLEIRFETMDVMQLIGIVNPSAAITTILNASPHRQSIVVYDNGQVIDAS